MKLEYLEEFLLLSKTENYTSVAESLFISESALSRHIMSLESELGVELFVRGSRNVSLSAAGKILVPYAQKVLDTMDKCAGALRLEHTLSHRKLTVGFVRSITQYGIMDKILCFRKENPDITVLLTEGNSEHLWQMARQAELDFAFCYEYPDLNSSELAVEHLIRDTMAVAIHANNPLSELNEVSFEQLKNEQFIMHHKSGALFKYCMQLFRSAGIKPEISTYVENRHYMLELVSHGLGVALLEKKRFFNDHPDNVRLVDIDPPYERYLSLVYRKRELCDTKKKFLSFIRENFGSSQGQP